MRDLDELDRLGRESWNGHAQGRAFIEAAREDWGEMIAELREHRESVHYAQLGKFMFDAIAALGEADVSCEQTKDEQVNAYIDTWRRQRDEIAELKSALMSFAFEPVAHEGLPCFCKYADDDYLPHIHSCRCHAARTVLAKYQPLPNQPGEAHEDN